jgi:hypothetical protein
MRGKCGTFGKKLTFFDDGPTMLSSKSGSARKV